METPAKRPPKQNHNRIILQFDYDCFYAQVHTNLQPHLSNKPLGIKQKNILATCNYLARSHGVRKLMLVTEARRICPELVTVDGEDLTPFRDVSKRLFGFFRGVSWNGKVERLGLDEVFMDVTDIVDYNVECLNRHSLEDTFFYLSRKDPEKGFSCNLTSIAGHVEGMTPDSPDYDNSRYVRLVLGSHLAAYLRQRLEGDFGYTSTCGISTNKTLSKLVGARHKPQAQTTLLALDDDDVIKFMDSHKLRKVPGIGSKTGALIEARVTGEQPVEGETITVEEALKVTVGQVRNSSIISPGSIETILSDSGGERGIGSKIWALLHGVDPTEVKEASDVPSQISIEDTFGGLNSMPQITEELHKLSYSLIRRLRVDLLVTDDGGEQKWLARPKTLRLSIRSWHQMHGQNYNRASRSGSFPSFVFDTSTDMEHLAERLVAESLLPLLRRLATEKGPKWNLQLINICAANMVMGAAEGKNGSGRDIANMFRTQDEVLRPWRVVDEIEKDSGQHVANDVPGNMAEVDEVETPADAWEASGGDSCPTCGCSMPSFALPAHLRYHELEEN